MQTDSGVTLPSGISVGLTADGAPILVDGERRQDARAALGIQDAESSFEDDTGPVGAVLRHWCMRAAAPAPLSLDEGMALPAHWSHPIDRHSKVLVIGGRRGAHAKDVNRPSRPTAFFKFPTAFAAPGAPLVLPRQDGRFEIDAAIGFVIGRSLLRASPEEAAVAIAGYVLLADVTDVDAYDEEARTNNGLLAKNHPGLSPVSPFIRLAQGPTPHFQVRLNVNGAEQQSFSTKDLQWTAEEAIAGWSLPTLVAGDIVAIGAALTASPSAAIAAGDEVEISCDGLGTIRHMVSAV